MVLSCLLIFSATAIMVYSALPDLNLLGILITLVSNLANVIHAELTANL